MRIFALDDSGIVSVKRRTPAMLTVERRGSSRSVSSSPAARATGVAEMQGEEQQACRCHDRWSDSAEACLQQLAQQCEAKQDSCNNCDIGSSEGVK